MVVDPRVFGDCESFDKKMEELFEGDYTQEKKTYIDSLRGFVEHGMESIKYELNKTQSAVACFLIYNLRRRSQTRQCMTHPAGMGKARIMAAVALGLTQKGRGA